MTCGQIEELLAAFALGALDVGEEASARAHLSICRRHDAELAEMAGVAATLALAVEEREPPLALRVRLIEAFEAEVSAQRRWPAPQAAILRPRRWFARPQFVYLAAAAVLVLAVVGLATWAAVLQLDGGQATIEAEFHGGGTGTLVYRHDDRTVELTLELPQPPAGRVYQAWGLFEQGPASLGIVPGTMVTEFNADLRDATAVAISIEPEGGSEQPTTEPLLVAELD